MKPSPLLFEMIRNLSSEEKDYFRKFSSMQQGEKNYLKLYNHLLTQSEYNETELKEHFKNESFIRHLPSEKNQLLHHILRSLRTFRYHTNDDAYISEEIKNIQLLFNKSLYRLARQELNRIKKLAYRNELFYSVLEIIELEKVVVDIEVQFDESNMLVVEELMNEKKAVFEKVASIRFFENILNEVTSIYYKFSFVKNEAERKKIENYLQTIEESKALAYTGNKALIASNLCKITALRLLHRNEELIPTVLNTLKLFDLEEEFIAERPVYYIMCYGFLVRGYALQQKFNNSFTCLDKIRSLEISPVFKPTYLQIAIFTRAAINDSMFYLYTGQFDKHQKMVPRIINGLNLHNGKIPDEELCTLHYILFMSHFGARKYSIALSWLNKLLNTPEKKMRPDLSRICRLANLVLHFELNNIDLLVYLCKATQRYYDSRTDIYPYEKVFLKHFRRLITPRNTNMQGLFSQLKEEIQEAFEDPYQKFALEYFDFDAWITSKMHEMTYQESIRMKRNAF
jgi:hypothetical protein